MSSFPRSRKAPRRGCGPGSSRSAAPAVEGEPPKVARKIPAPAAGVLREILLHSNEDANPGAVLGRIAPAIEIGEVEHAPAKPERTNVSPSPDPQPVRNDAPGRESRLSPSVKRAVLQHD